MPFSRGYLYLNNENRETSASALFPRRGGVAISGQFPSEAAAVVDGVLLPQFPERYVADFRAGIF